MSRSTYNSVYFCSNDGGFFVIYVNLTTQGRSVRDQVSSIRNKVNIGEENQKSGINKNDLKNFYNYCNELNLDIIGLMCIPPVDVKTDIYFKEMSFLKNNLALSDLSMGMSSDYLEAIKNSSTYVRIGSKIFGKRS